MSPVAQFMRNVGFQSPFHRGNGCNQLHPLTLLSVLCAFSPLFIGETVVTLESVVPGSQAWYLSVPFSSGKRL